LIEQGVLDVLVLIRVVKRLFFAALISLVLWEGVEPLELSEHRDEHGDDNEREEKELELSDSIDEAFKLAARLRMDEFIELCVSLLSSGLSCFLALLLLTDRNGWNMEKSELGLEDLRALSSGMSPPRCSR
jgi:hypothetical protein